MQQAHIPTLEKISALLSNDENVSLSFELQVAILELQRHRAAQNVGRDVGSWQPIETAPRDGTFVDLWAHFPEFGSERRVPNALWMDGEWFLGQFFASQYQHPPRITHWMPLPIPPKVVGQNVSSPAPAEERRGNIRGLLPPTR